MPIVEQFGFLFIRSAPTQYRCSMSGGLTPADIGAGFISSIKSGGWKKLATLNIKTLPCSKEPTEQTYIYPDFKESI